MNPFSYIARNVPDIPEHLGVEPFTATSHGDSSLVEGWSWKPAGEIKGTIFCLHGFTDHCRNPGSWPHWISLAAKHDLALVAFDFRHHGRSGDRWPTFGSGEAWDLLGAMDRAEELGFPLPYIVSAASLGAMAAQRAAAVDGRIRGCFLAEPPQCPWHAVGCAVWNGLSGVKKLLVPLATIGGGKLINAHYGWDILSDGDVRRNPAIRNPSHQPLMFFVMGTNDEFEIHKTRMVYDAWYEDVPGAQGTGMFPADDRNAQKWFIEVEGAQHSSRGGYTVFGWEHFGVCMDSFLRRCLE